LKLDYISRVRIEPRRRLAIEPVEVERLGETRIDRIIGDEPRTLAVLRIADAELAVDVEDCIDTAWAGRGAGQVEAIAIGVVIPVDWAHQVAVGRSLLELSLEVIDRVLRSSHAVIELVVSTVVDSSNSEGESTRNVDSQSQLTVLPILSNRDTRTSFGSKGTERNSNRHPIL